jgi:hypothetical protein
MTEDSARARGIIATIVVLGMVALCFLLFYREVPATSEKILLVILGALLAMVADIKSFYFGTSAGAKSLSTAQIETNKALVDKVAGAGSNALSDAKPAGTAEDPVVTQDARSAPPSDPEFEAFSEMVKSMNKRASDAEILTAWASIKSRRGDVDVDTSRAH